MVEVETIDPGYTTEAFHLNSLFTVTLLFLQMLILFFIHINFKELSLHLPGSCIVGKENKFHIPWFSLLVYGLNPAGKLFQLEASACA